MADDDVFWDMAETFLARDGVEEGTMFGYPCLRADGEFVAMPSRMYPGLIVKLPAERVAGLVEAGTGEPVAPAGRTFKEWVAVEDETLWEDLIAESIVFVTS